MLRFETMRELRNDYELPFNIERLPAIRAAAEYGLLRKVRSKK